MAAAYEFPKLPFQLLPRAAFSGVEFPVKGYRVRGGIRYHVHEYPHTPAGVVEKLGRKLYQADFDSAFHTTFPAWPGIWPGRLALLRSLFEAETTAELVIPSIGPMRAVCIDWDQSFESRVLTGEEAKFSFLEDQESAFAFNRLFKSGAASITRYAEQFDTAAALYEFRNPGSFPKSLIDQVLDLADLALAALDQPGLYSDLVQRRFGALARLCSEFDSRVEAFNDPRAYPVLEAMKGVWSVALENSGQDQPALVFGRWTVRLTTPITTIAGDIYGDTSRATELLQLNPIEDAFAVPAGSELRYVLPSFGA